MNWHDSFSTYVWIFAVGRGNAAFVRTGLNQGFLVDMNASEFDVAGFIKKNFVPKLAPYSGNNKRAGEKGNAIAQAILSHPHADHISQCEELKPGRALHPSLLTCPHDKSDEEKLNWDRVKNQERDKGLVSTYKSLYRERSLPLQTIRFESSRMIPNLEYGVFYIRPPVCESIHETDDLEYANSTSIMFYLRFESNSILIPGDMTPEGMRLILKDGEGVEKRYTVFDTGSANIHPNWHDRTSDQPGLASLLGSRGLSILVTPHHGLESCYSPELFDAIKAGKPRLNIISERRHKNDNDGEIHDNYRSKNGAIGLEVEIEGKWEERCSLSTVNDHHILVVFKSSGAPDVYADRDPDRLLKKM